MYKQLLLFSLLFLTLQLSGQIVEKSMNMSAGEQNGLEVDLSVDSKSAEKLWKEYVKPYGKVDWDRKNKEHVLFDTRIPSISSESLTVVTRFNQMGNKAKASFWIKLGEAYISSEENSDEVRAAGAFLQEFGYETERARIKEELKNQEKALEKLQKDLGKLEKKNGNLHKDIEKAKQEIAKKENEIDENEREQERKKKDIGGQKDKIKKTTIKLTQVGNSGD